MEITIQTQGLPDGSNREKVYTFWINAQQGLVEIPWDDEIGYARHFEQESWLRALPSPCLRPTVFGHFELMRGAADVHSLLTILEPVSIGKIEGMEELEKGNARKQENDEPGRGGSE